MRNIRDITVIQICSILAGKKGKIINSNMKIPISVQTKTTHPNNICLGKTRDHGKITPIANITHNVYFLFYARVNIIIIVENEKMAKKNLYVNYLCCLLLGENNQISNDY